MKFTAQQIAEILKGDIVGNENTWVNTLSKIEQGEQGSLTFLANPKYENYIYTTKASIAIVNRSFEPKQDISHLTLVKVDDAYGAFSKVLEFYHEATKQNKQGREHPVFIDETASIGVNEYIGAFSYIGANVKIGNNVKIYPNSHIGDHTIIGDNTIIYAGVKVYNQTHIGSNCKIHSGVVIGSDGFGFAPNEKGEFVAVPQTGNVVIEDNVDIGANTVIDRATIGSTIIKQGVKLDNLIQIAHNVEVGKHTVIASQTGIAGSTKIGEHCMIGGQVGIVGHLSLGNNLQIQAQSGISKNLKDGSVVQGTPAFDYKTYNKSYVVFRNLSKLSQTVNSLEKQINVQNKDNGKETKNNI